MKRNYTGKLIVFFAAAFSLCACHKEEDFPLLEEGILPMVFQGEVRSYDEDTKAGEALAFNNGATLYVRLENGASVVLGTAVYRSETEAWTFTYNGSIAGWDEVHAKCYYIPSFRTSSRTELSLDYNYPFYSDEAASMLVETGKVTLSAHLTPKTGRLSLGKGLPAGVNKNVKLLSGLSYYTGFKLNDYTLTTAGDTEIPFAATSSNYFYGFFSNQDDPSILLQYGLYQYSRSFGADTPVLKAGHSGYLTVPSSYSHEGWTFENEIEPDTDEITVNGVSFKMVTIPGGSFSMGMENVTTPVHEVTLDEFQLGETEVTQELWEAVMGNNPSSFYGQANLPVETVSYWEIQLFLFRLRGLTGLSFRLPTEAEWEYAARESMGSPLMYSGSDVLPDVGWYGGNSDDATHPVKQKGANGLGLYDMSGNVWEVVSDWYSGYSSEPQNNPRGYAYSGNGPVRRGGSYRSESTDPCSVAARTNWGGYTDGSADMGFRLALGGPRYEPEMVDLGLPSGLKWASFNLGATRPTEMGNYFAWGETEPKTSYNWSNYAFIQSGQSDEWHIGKYTIEDGYSNDGSWYDDGVFVGDGRRVLDMEDDAARTLWGDEWRIPTPTDWQELRDNCDISWVYASNETDGISSLIVTSRENGNSIYLPAVGYFNTNGLVNANSYTYYYQTNTIGYRSSYSTAAYMGNTYLEISNSYERYRGYNIRPVSGDGNNYAIEVSANEEEGISFGIVATNNTAYRTFTVQNTGALPFPMKATVEGTGFTISPSGDINIPVGMTQEYTVSFTPSSGDEYYGFITLSSTKLPQDKQFFLEGTGNVVSSTEYTVNGITFKMVSIPGGTFQMGKENYATPNHQVTLVHQVTLDSYMLGETEVTQELWQAVMGNNPSYRQGARYPVENVNWLDAKTFIGKLNILTGMNFHLPTEAEWEYAAREAGSDYYRFSGSNTLSEVGWHGGNSDDATHPVKQKKANALGLYDMSGNVWEWCQDCYYDYADAAQANPVGYAWGSPLTRGGAYTDDEFSVYDRHTDSATDRYSNHGFRLALGGGSCHEPEMVDLGLPSGLKWASFNIGAARPAEFGYYFAWGETELKDNYEWSSYLFEQPGYDSWYQINKYTFEDGNGGGIWYDNGVFIGDNLTVLEMEDDAANILWQDGWRIPSIIDWQELIENCSVSWVYDYDVEGGPGMVFTGPNGNRIFLPASGYRSDVGFSNLGSWSYYQSSSVGSNNSYFTGLNIGDPWANLDSGLSRYQGFPIRPVNGSGNNYGLELSTSEIHFANAPVGEASEMVFQVKNTGYLPLTITVNCDNSAFASSESSFTLGGKQNKNITVSFTPTDASSYSGSINVSAGELGSAQTVSLSGTGINIVYETFSAGGVEFKMVSVPGGTFDMGMDAGRQVTLDNYYIGQTEVTQELWTAVMGSNPSSHTGLANLPIENISWFNAKVFIERLSDLTGEHFRLPTEAEWEYAARGGSYASYDTYSGGNDLDAIAWNSNNSAGTTHPVKTKAPNYLGIYDMSGNVWEWCEGFYGELPDNGTVNPRGWPYNESKYPNYRGGSFQSTTECSVINRSSSDYEAESTSNNVGLRIALGGPSYSPEAIDLGLPSGVKWSSFNIGACAPEEIGGFYAWGETVQKTTYEWSNYSYLQPGYTDVDHLTKYSEFDSKTVLEAEDDVATTRWGAGWRIPTTEEWIELVSNTTTTPEQLNGVKGLRLTSSINGNSLFLPTCGYFTNRWCKTNVWDYGYSFGHEFLYPSSSLYIYGMTDAIMYRSDDYHIAWGGFDRYIGVQVRPVHD